MTSRWFQLQKAIIACMTLSATASLFAVILSRDWADRAYAGGMLLAMLFGLYVEIRKHIFYSQRSK